jgi:hypothetical protein
VPDILFKISMFEKEKKKTFRRYGLLTKIISILPIKQREIFAVVEVSIRGPFPFFPLEICVKLWRLKLHFFSLFPCDINDDTI